MRLLTKPKASLGARWLHPVGMRGYLCPYKIPAFWGIVWVMWWCLSLLANVIFMMTIKIETCTNRVVILFFFFFEKWTFVHQQKTQVSKLHGCQMADIFITAVHNFDVNFWHKDGAISYPRSSPSFDCFLNLLGYWVLYVFVRKYC